MSFRFSAGHCATGDCGCRECTTGTICVALVAPCTLDDLDGVLITVFDHATLDPVASELTASDGTACIAGLPFGDYDVVGLKAGCIEIDWATVTLGCETRTLTGSVTCLPFAARRFRVLGCFGEPLPGATVTVTGPAGGVAVADGDGVAYFHYPTTGVYTATVSDPSGRFTPKTLPSWTVTNVCDASNNGDVQLVAASGFQCCDVQKQVTPISPYPIKTTLKLTDSGGSTSFTANAGCGGSACDVRSMPDSSSATAGVTFACAGGGLGVKPPSIGSNNVPIKYVMSMSAGGASLAQGTPEYYGVSGGGVHYRSDVDTTSRCDLPNTFRGWRIAGDCTFGGTFTTRNSTGYVINSLNPINITFTFAAGTGFGPSPTAVSGSPFSTTVVLSE